MIVSELIDQLKQHDPNTPVFWPLRRAWGVGEEADPITSVTEVFIRTEEPDIQLAQALRAKKPDSPFDSNREDHIKSLMRHCTVIRRKFVTHEEKASARKYVKKERDEGNWRSDSAVLTEYRQKILLIHS